MSKSLVAIRPKGYNSIIWTTNDICPFKCWYCPESIWGGNTKTPFTWDQCSDFLDVIYERIPTCSFVITGGEPTDWFLFPNLLDKVYTLNLHNRTNLGWCIFVISNMSKSKGFIDEWIDKTHYVCASYHPNVINTSKKREAWLKKVLSFKHRTRIQIRLLMDPRHWDHCLEMFHSLNDNDIMLEPVTVLNYMDEGGYTGTSDFIKEYTPEQIEIITELKTKIGSTSAMQGRPLQYNPNEIILKFSNGDTRILKDQTSAHVYHQLVSKKLNRFKGWHCEIGLNDLFIGAAGNIAASVCMSHVARKYIGNIVDIDKIKWPTKATICPYEWCLCGSDLMIPKYKVTEEHAA